MAQLTDLFPAADLHAEIDSGHVLRKQHPTLPLSLYAYSRSCQYENHWTPVTTRCRGLVVDDTDGRIVAWCLPKFFNHDQHGAGHDFAPPLPTDEPFEVFDKVDGSLGIVFHFAGRWHVASKGSFVSEYRGDWERLGGQVVRSWPTPSLTELARLAAENTKLDGTPATGTDAEGWVVRFRSGVRVKIKIAEYVRLHRSLTGTNARDVWQYLGAQKFGHLPAKALGQTLGCSAEQAKQWAGVYSGALSKLLENVPDEFDTWVRGVVAGLEAAAEELDARIGAQFASLAHLHGDRGAFARAAQAVEDRSVRAALFLVLDGKSTDLHVWRAIRPELSDPFAADEEG